MNDSQLTFLNITTNIVSTFVSNNTVLMLDLPALIQTTYDAVENTQKTPEPVAVVQEPAVSIRASIKPDYIVCLEDGKKLKMLKRHLMTHYQMTPEQYRAKWNLPSDYPMTAPNYAAKRAELAKRIGLGVKPKANTTVAQ
jgi:predicted transcriptional regulator